jgi:hypothetical protein
MSNIVKGILKWGGAAGGLLIGGPEGAMAGYEAGETIGDVGESIVEFFEGGEEASPGIPAMPESTTMKRLRASGKSATQLSPIAGGRPIYPMIFPPSPLTPSPMSNSFSHLTPKDVITKAGVKIYKNTMIPAIQNENPNPGFGTNGFGNSISFAHKQMMYLDRLERHKKAVKRVEKRKKVVRKRQKKTEKNQKK